MKHRDSKYKVSDCCGASPRNDIEEEVCLCSDCGEHCEYIKDGDHG